MAPNRMTAYNQARAAEQPKAPTTSILDLEPDAFRGALDELGIVGEERALLEQQYFAQNRALPMTPRPEGKRVGTVAPIAFPEDMTGAEALMSGNFDFTTPEFIRGMYEAPAEAMNVVGAAAKGVPVTEQQLQEAAINTAGSITGLGTTTFAARSLARGVEMPDPTVVSMSGVRGMGDNGGPALEQFDEIPAGPPRRYINPQSGMYSPSYEAAKALPQEVGTAQQMRAMLLRGGAKEEELAYSGFDNWLKGRDKVTKEEIEDVLFDSAAGFADGTMPYVRVSDRAGSGVTGVSGRGLTIYQLRRDSVERRRQEAAEARNNELMAEIQALGYRPLQFTDETDFRAVTGQLRGAYDSRRNEYFDQDFNPLPRREVRDAIFQAQDLMDTFGLPFDSPQVQDVLQPLSQRSAIGVQQFIGPSGRIQDSTSLLISLGRTQDRGELPFFDDIPPEQVERIQNEINEMPVDQLAGYLGLDPNDVVERFDPARTRYANFVVPGMRNYSENQYLYRDEGRGVLSGIQSLGAQNFNQSHFGAGQKPLMFFTLTGELKTPDGPAYHLAQLQSDIGQTYNDNPNQFFVPGSASETMELTKPQKQVLRQYIDLGKRMKEADGEYGRLYNEHFEKYMGSDGMWRKDAPGYAESKDAANNAKDTRDKLKQQLLLMDDENWDFLYANLANAYQTPQLMSTIQARGFSPGEFDPTPFEEILSGKAVPVRGPAYGKTAALPFATSTNRWLDAALKNELINAAKAGAEWVTIPKGDDVQRYTYGKREGQRKFYGGPDERGIAPTRLKNLAQKLIPFETEFKDIEATGFGPNPPTYNVFGMRLTPEIRKFLLEEGLPSFAKGGPVHGSSLDVDVFAFP
jgi:hypothetical protein